VLARFLVARLDPAAELLLLVGGEEGDFVDFLEIGLEAAFGGNG
jgi:hypothetical protein